MRRILLTLLCLSALLPAAAQRSPRHVELSLRDDGRWTFLVDGNEYFAQGATVYPLSQDYYGVIANYGANMIRNHRTYTTMQDYLDNAQRLGLMVHAGLEFRSIRSGYYDGDEAAAIAEQEERLLEVVETFKDHPAILCWCIGNEFEIGHSEKPLTAQYESVERIARRIHEIDSHHPVTLAVVDGFPPAKVHGLKEICRSLDFLSCNGYIKQGDRYPVLGDLDKIGWEKPVFCTELGPEGWWLHESLEEGRYCPWGAVVDYTSTEKEEKYDRCIRAWVDDPRCVGVATFLWGNQNGSRDEVLEWYGLLSREGYTYGAVDVMQRYWTGSAPAAPAPRIESRKDIRMNGKTADRWIRVEPGSENRADVVIGNPSKAALRIYWRIVPERSRGMDFLFPDGISGLIRDNGRRHVHFRAPSRPGAYRLYVHVYDDVNRKAAYAGIPFHVEGDAEGLSDWGGRP